MVLATAGCRAHERAYPGQSTATVWTAARTVAVTPDYDAADVADRWIVEANEVLADEEAGTLEIFRELSRLHLRSGGDRFTERRTWKLGVRVQAAGDTPVVSVVSRGLAVPAHVRTEAERFFDQIAALLEAPEPRRSSRSDGNADDSAVARRAIHAGLATPAADHPPAVDHTPVTDHTSAADDTSDAGRSVADASRRDAATSGS